MRRQALVVLGAGASSDLLAPNEEHISANSEYRPPLTEGVFSSQPSFQRILHEYPDASALAESIRVRPPAQSLEVFLRQLSESRFEHRQRQFKEVPLYLQELLGKISENYLQRDAVVRQPPNYTHLVNELLCHYDRIGFVTLNYDLLLERVLQIPSLAGGPPEDMDWYIRDKWLLVKLHGSVNWGRRIIEYPGKLTVAHRLENIGDTPLDDNLDESVTILPAHYTRWVGGVPYYPAIVVPLEGKYGFSCPGPHVDSLKEFLRSCRDVLVIGISGKDADLLELLRDCLPDVLTFHLVDRGRTNLEATKARLAQEVPQLRASRTAFFQTFEQGFTKFIEDSGVERFATRVR